jgi:hypothetical protein
MVLALIVSTREDGEYIFDNSEWAAFDQSLELIDPVLEQIAQRYGLKLLGAASKGWPGRTLRKRRFLGVYRVQISLDPSFIDTASMRWGIHESYMYDFGELYRKTISFRTLASGISFSRSGAAAISRLLENAVRESLETP